MTEERVGRQNLGYILRQRYILLTANKIKLLKCLVSQLSEQNFSETRNLGYMKENAGNTQKRKSIFQVKDLLFIQQFTA